MGQSAESEFAARTKLTWKQDGDAAYTLALPWDGGAVFGVVLRIVKDGAVRFHSHVSPCHSVVKGMSHVGDDPYEEMALVEMHLVENGMPLCGVVGPDRLSEWM